MKEHPILFSAPMITAILEGRKKQTRRLVKGFPLTLLEPGMFSPEYVAMPENDFCQYGNPGDRLWVREPFAKQLNGYFIYKADYTDGLKPEFTATGRWKPSIHMPRAASRITLEVESVRVERLHDISRDDAISEGVYYSEHLQGYCTDDDGRNFHYSDPRISYAKLWCAINGSESWDENPWVWIITFKNISHANP